VKQNPEMREKVLCQFACEHTIVAYLLGIYMLLYSVTVLFLYDIYALEYGVALGSGSHSMSQRALAVLEPANLGTLYFVAGFIFSLMMVLPFVWLSVAQDDLSEEDCNYCYKEWREALGTSLKVFAYHLAVTLLMFLVGYLIGLLMKH